MSGGPRTRPFPLLALALAVLLALATGACGGGGDGAGPVDNGTLVGGAPAPSTGEETTATTAAPRTVTIAASGDILMHTPVNAAGLANGGGTVHDFGPMFELVAPEISAADVAICHMETPISPDD